MWHPGAARKDVIRRVLKAFWRSTQPSLTTAQICAFLRSDDNAHVYNALVQLRQEGVLACTSGQWWVRDSKLAAFIMNAREQ